MDVGRIPASQAFRAVSAHPAAVGREQPLDSCEADKLLALQDVFPIFWKRIGRARWYHDRAWELLQRSGPRR